jgi:hypothetical protein
MSDSKKRCCLRIAGFGIAIESDQPLLIEEGYKPFIAANDIDCSISIQCHAGLVNAPKASGTPAYQASYEEGKLWEVFEEEDQLTINVYQPEKPHGLQQVCMVDRDLKTWQVWSEPQAVEGSVLINPLEYPLGPLIMYHLTLIEECIMIHASGVAINDNGSIFTGVSGKGKTTMARLWFEAGAEVLNDDRLIIRKEKGGYTVHNTPMFYEDKPRSASLKAIHIIHHAKENVAERLTGAESVAAVAANCIQHGYRSESVAKHLAFLEKLVLEVPVYEVGFLPDSSIVQYLQQTHAAN